MQMPNNRRCGHCGTRDQLTVQTSCWGFTVRLCDPCIETFWEELVDFLPFRRTFTDLPEGWVPKQPVRGPNPAAERSSGATRRL